MSLRRDVVILACATSAGIHGALAPDHFSEGVGVGGGFVAATLLLAVTAVVLTLRPRADVPLMFAALQFGGLIASYAFAVTTGLPVLHPAPEPIDGLAVATKAIETAGLIAAMTLIGRRPAFALHPQTKGI